MGTSTRSGSPARPSSTPATDEIFVAEETETGRPKRLAGDPPLARGDQPDEPQELWHRDIDPPFANNPSHYYIPAEQQRPALTLANGRLYVDFGGLDGDCGQYHGYVVDLPESRAGAL